MPAYQLKHHNDVEPEDIPNIVHCSEAQWLLEDLRGTSPTFARRENLSDTILERFEYEPLVDF